MARLGTAYVLPSAAQTVTFNSGDIVLDEATAALLFLMNVSAITGTTPSMVATIDGKGPDGVYYNLYTAAAVTTVSQTKAQIGPALPVNVELTPVIRVSFAIAGTTPSVTMSATVEQESS